MITPLALLATLAGGCGGGNEISVQNAREGDLLVKTAANRVHLARPFRRGVPNGLYSGAVNIVTPGGAAQETLHEVNSVCSVEGVPGWPDYDNLYGQPISTTAQQGSVANPSRWQILFHFDGRIERIGKAPEEEWPSRLRDNLCRRGDFDDRPQAVRDKAAGS